MTPPMHSVTRVDAANLPAFTALIAAIAAEHAPADLQAQARAVAGVHASLACYDFTRSDSTRVLLAALAGAPAGYALAVRVPKADARAGFLFVDNLYVLAAFRRAGIAAALLRECETVAREWGLCGIRLLVRLENTAAQRLYRAAGYAESPTGFREKLLA